MRFFEFSSLPAVRTPINPAKAAERRKKANDAIAKARARTSTATQDFQAKQDADDDAERNAQKRLQSS